MDEGHRSRDQRSTAKASTANRILGGLFRKSFSKSKPDLSTTIVNLNPDDKVIGLHPSSEVKMSSGPYQLGHEQTIEDPRLVQRGGRSRWSFLKRSRSHTNIPKAHKVPDESPGDKRHSVGLAELTLTAALSAGADDEWVPFMRARRDREAETCGAAGSPHPAQLRPYFTMNLDPLVSSGQKEDPCEGAAVASSNVCQPQLKETGGNARRLIVDASHNIIHRQGHKQHRPCPPAPPTKTSFIESGGNNGTCAVQGSGKINVTGDIRNYCPPHRDAIYRGNRVRNGADKQDIPLVSHAGCQGDNYHDNRDVKGDVHVGECNNDKAGEGCDAAEDIQCTVAAGREHPAPQTSVVGVCVARPSMERAQLRPGQGGPVTPGARTQSPKMSSAAPVVPAPVSKRDICGPLQPVPPKAPNKSYHVRESCVLHLQKEADVEGEAISAEDADIDQGSGPATDDDSTENIHKQILAHCELSMAGIKQGSTQAMDSLNKLPKPLGLQQLKQPNSSSTSRDSGFDQLTNKGYSPALTLSEDSTLVEDGSSNMGDNMLTVSDAPRHTVKIMVNDDSAASDSKNDNPFHFSGSLNSFPSSEDSADDSDSYTGKVVVRKSRSYHDLVRQRSRTRNSACIQGSGDNSETCIDGQGRKAKCTYHIHGSVSPRPFSPSSCTDQSDLSGQLLFVKHLRPPRLIVSSHSRLAPRGCYPNRHIRPDDNGSPSTIPTSGLKRSGSLDSLSTTEKHSRHKNVSKALQRRSMAFGENFGYEGYGPQPSEPVCETPLSRASPHRHWQSTGSVMETPASKKERKKLKHKVSMAASATYIPGASLADKLRLAASKGQIDKIRELLSSGATFEPDREGRTALHYAALNGNHEAVKTLLVEGCDIDAQDALGYTALHRAAAQGHLEVIRVLVLDGCLIDRQDEVHGNAALHEAAWNGYSKTLELLLKNKANLHVVNKAGFTALHLAAQNGHNQSSRVLLYAGCNSNCKNNYGDTALHTAARYGHAGVTRILISAHVRLNEQNKNGDTSLHISAALKRRKITKLLVDAGINISVKNKQNETAAEVAKRKDHAEILLIITSQPKEAKKKAKAILKREKSTKVEEEKKEKKGFFFKKKNKNKDKTPVEIEVRAPNHPVKNPLAPSLPPPSAPSEISSSDFTSAMSPEEILKGFRQHVVRCQKEGPPGSVVGGATSRGTSTKCGQGAEGKQGLLSKYDYKRGTQYYRDLAGNIKEGPIGFAPVCKCGPTLKKLEKKIDADRHNLYDHIDASHRTLSQRIEHLDHRTAQQVYSIDKLTRERLEAERREQEEYIRARMSEECGHVQRHVEDRQDRLQSEMQVWMSSQYSNLERRYNSHARGCDWCHSEVGNQAPVQERQQLHYHRDDMLNQQLCYEAEELPPPPGKLFRSRSDESLASSHPSRRHWKMKGTSTKDVMEGFRAPSAAERASRIERKLRHKARKEEREARAVAAQIRDSTPEVRSVRERPSSYHEEVHGHTGRTPDGQSPGEDAQPSRQQRDYAVNPHSGLYGSLPRRKISDDMRHQRGSSMDRVVQQSTGNVQQGRYGNQMQVDVQVHHVQAAPSLQHLQKPDVADPKMYCQGINTHNGLPSSTSMEHMRRIPPQPQKAPPPPPPPRSVSHSAALNHTPSTNPAPVSQPNANNQNFRTAHQGTTAVDPPCNSPDSGVVVHHSKTDSGSNPDSGYGSRIYGRDQARFGKVPGSTGSSFQSSSPDPHNSSVGTNTSRTTDGSSPGYYYNDLHRFRPQPNNSPASNTTSPNVPPAVSQWFERKLREGSVERNNNNVPAQAYPPHPQQQQARYTPHPQMAQGYRYPQNPPSYHTGPGERQQPVRNAAYQAAAGSRPMYHPQQSNQQGQYSAQAQADPYMEIGKATQV